MPESINLSTLVYVWNAIAEEAERSGPLSLSAMIDALHAHGVEVVDDSDELQPEVRDIECKH